MPAEQVDLVSVDGVRLDAVAHRRAGDVLGCGVVVQAHGINADMTEGGMFVRLADRLVEAGFEVLRFSFRGHGRSGGTQRGATIAGEMLDLQAAVDCARRLSPGPLTVVASSFGAVSTALSLDWLSSRQGLRRLVLWNPVLDLVETFVEPVLPWGLENYGLTRQAGLLTDGYLTIDGEFELGRVMFGEFRRYDPFNALIAHLIPALVVHGDRDTAVSYATVQRLAAARPDTDLHTVVGSDHGFDSREKEDEAIAVTVDWLQAEAGTG